MNSGGAGISQYIKAKLREKGGWRGGRVEKRGGVFEIN